MPYTKFEYNPYEHEVEKHIYYSKVYGGITVDY